MNPKNSLWKLILPVLSIGLVAEIFIGFAIYCVVANKDMSTFQVVIIVVIFLFGWAIIKFYQYRKYKDDNNDDDQDTRVHF